MYDDELSFKKTIEALKQLPFTEAPKDFETTLWRRINSESYQPRYEQERWWERFLVPSRLIPAAALSVTALILIFVLNVSSADAENPLVTMPRLREDVVQNTTKESNTSQVKEERSLSSNEQTEMKSSSVNKQITTESPSEVDQLADNSLTTTGVETVRREQPVIKTTVFRNAAYSGAINKSGFNFLQKRVTPEDRERINQLRERIKGYFNKSGK